MTNKISICMRDKVSGSEGARFVWFRKANKGHSIYGFYHLPSTMEHLIPQWSSILKKILFDSNPFPNQISNSDTDKYFQPAVTRVVGITSWISAREQGISGGSVSAILRELDDCNTFLFALRRLRMECSRPFTYLLPELSYGITVLSPE